MEGEIVADKVVDKCIVCGANADSSIRADWLDIEKIVPLCDECWKGFGETYAENYELYTLEEASNIFSERYETRRDAYD